MKKIYFWSPHNSNIGTINSVINSITSIGKFSKKDYRTYLIDSTNEWVHLKDSIDIIELRKNRFDFRNLKNKGFFWSRVFYLNIFISCFIPLKRLLKYQKPEYLIIHLITSLPLFLFLFFNFKTKLILRISGEPKLNFFRKFFWKVLSSKIYKVTCPSSKTREMLIKNSIFNANQVIVLLDPIVNIKKIKYYKNIDIDKDYINTNYFLAVGRLTKQKNFDFLISTFKIINNSHSDLELIILGEGEERENLETKIKELDLINIVHLKGFESNVFNYMKNAKCLILPSIYENPGHVLIEAAACNCPIISSNCPTGPAEFLSDGRAGFLFEVNNKKDLIKKTNSFLNQNSKETKKKKILAKKNSMNYTMFRHFRIFRNIL